MVGMVREDFFDFLTTFLEILGHGGTNKIADTSTERAYQSK